MKFTALFLIGSLAALGCTAQVASVPPRVIYDGRIQPPEPRLTESERGRIQYLAWEAAEQDAWNVGSDALSYCGGSDFVIDGVAPGAFTTKGKQQAAYLYTYCYQRPGDLQGIVIVQGNGIVAHYVFVNHFRELYALKDVNRNGFTELLLSGGFTGQGYTENWINIAELGPQRRLLGQLDYDHPPQAYSDNCGTVETGGTWQSFVLRVVPSASPTFTRQAISGRCGAERVATSIGTIKPLTLKPTPTGWLAGPLK